MRSRRQLPRAAVLCAAIAIVSLSLSLSVGGGDVRADTGTSQGTISGSGTIDVGGETTGVYVSASLAGAPLSGTFAITKYPTGTPSPSPSLQNVVCVWISGTHALVGGFYQGTPVFIWISDGGPTGPDTLEVSPQQFGPDCTTGPIGPNPTVLASGDFTVHDIFSDVAPADGIVDTLQPSGTAAGSFVDTSVTPATYGSIVSTGGLYVNIKDAPAPDGVQVNVGNGSPGPAELSLCGFTVLFDTGTLTTATCGSITLAVASGTASVVLGAGTTVVSIPAGGTGKVADTGGGTFSVSNLGATGSPPVSLTVGGTTTQISTGTVATSAFVGFTQPVDNEPVLNQAKAGQTIPLKWRLVTLAGAPITNVTTATITVSSYDCSLAPTIDQVEEVAAGASGLQNLGNGYYLLNWKSPSTYTGSCKTLHLSAGGLKHDALFKFTK